MIYTLYINGLRNWKAHEQLPEAQVRFAGQSATKLMGDFIRKHPEHKFVAITTTEQEPDVAAFMQEAGLTEEDIDYKWERGVTNGNYPDMKRRLMLRVFQSKKGA